VIFEGGALNEHPGHQLGKIADENKAGPPVAAEQGQVYHGENGQQPAPANHGIDPGAEAGHALSVGSIAEIIQYGPDVQHPLIPAGGIGMGGLHAQVVAHHELLVSDNDVGVFLGEVHAQTLQTLGLAVRVVAGIVYDPRNEHKEHKT